MPNNRQKKFRKSASKVKRADGKNRTAPTEGINAEETTSACSSSSSTDSPPELTKADLPKGFTENPWTKRCTKCSQNFSTAEARDKHIKDSPQHNACMYCDAIIDFGNRNELHLHFRKVHAIIFCLICNKHFRKMEARNLHMRKTHAQCNLCLKDFLTRDLLFDHCAKSHPETKTVRPYVRDKIIVRASDHYTVLGVCPESTQDQIVKAAKEMRISSHPDRLKRQEELTEEEKHDIDVNAMLIGQAADILSDPDLRRKYDLKRYTCEGNASAYSKPKKNRGR